MMDDLWLAIGHLATDLHKDRVDSLAKAIAEIKSLDEFDRIRTAFGPNIDSDQIDALRSAWETVPETLPREIAAALFAAAQAAKLVSLNEAVELVWTGPKTGLIPTRNTEQVILEVIDRSESELFLVSYVFYNAPSIIECLNKAITRGVRVRILLESSSEHGGTIRGDSIQAMANLVQDAVIYVWDSEAKAFGDTHLSAAVHAKCAVADGDLAFITSANLTSAALERNMELGVLLRGGVAPIRLHDHLKALVTTKEIKEWKS